MTLIYSVELTNLAASRIVTEIVAKELLDGTYKDNKGLGDRIDKFLTDSVADLYYYDEVDDIIRGAYEQNIEALIYGYVMRELLFQKRTKIDFKDLYVQDYIRTVAQITRALIKSKNREIIKKELKNGDNITLKYGN